MGPKFGAQKGNKLGSQLGPMSITKLSPNWACQMGPIHCPKFLLSGLGIYIYAHARTHTQATGIHRHRSNVNTTLGKLLLWLFSVIISSLFTNFFVKPAMTGKIGLKLRNLSEYFDCNLWGIWARTPALSTALLVRKLLKPRLAVFSVERTIGNQF